MLVEKAIEILELNVKEAGNKMPPDCLAALRLAIMGLDFISKTCPTPFKHALDRQEVIWDAKAKPH